MAVRVLGCFLAVRVLASFLLCGENYGCPCSCPCSLFLAPEGLELVETG